MLSCPETVMPGLVPGIHVFSRVYACKDVDGRDKPGHDESKGPLRRHSIGSFTPPAWPPPQPPPRRVRRPRSFSTIRTDQTEPS